MEVVGLPELCPFLPALFVPIHATDRGPEILHYVGYSQTVQKVMVPLCQTHVRVFGALPEFPR